MWNAGLDEAQTRIKIAGRNINNLRYADDTTLMSESKKEVKSLLIRVKETEKAREFQKNIYFCFTDYAKAFDSVDHSKLWKKRWEYQTTLSAPWETCMQVKKQQLEPDMEQWTGSK